MTFHQNPEEEPLLKFAELLYTEAFRRLGSEFVDYINKPIRKEELLARVSTHLSLALLQRRSEELVRIRIAELKDANRQLRQNIEEKEQSEAALRLSEQQYRNLAEHIAEGIVIIQDGLILFANTAITEMLNHPAGFLTGKQSSEFFFCPQQLEHNLQRQNLLGSGRNTFTCLEQSVNEDGTQMWFEIVHTRIEWQNAPAVLLNIRDVTRHKQQEQLLRKKQHSLERENIVLKSTLTDRYKLGDIIGKSPAMQQRYDVIAQSAATNETVLLQGETGVGKELVARTIHDLSARRKKPFVVVNSGAVHVQWAEQTIILHPGWKPCCWKTPR